MFNTRTLFNKENAIDVGPNKNNLIDYTESENKFYSKDMDDN